MAFTTKAREILPRSRYVHDRRLPPPRRTSYFTHCKHSALSSSISALRLHHSQNTPRRRPAHPILHHCPYICKHHTQHATLQPTYPYSETSRGCANLNTFILPPPSSRSLRGDNIFKFHHHCPHFIGHWQFLLMHYRHSPFF